MKLFLWGALAMSSLVAALFFLRFFRNTRDRLFLFFSLAFMVFTADWVLIACTESRYLYVLRLVGFLLIIIGVADKNRRGAP
jgi:hypothetical protein